MLCTICELEKQAFLLGGLATLYDRLMEAFKGSFPCVGRADIVCKLKHDHRHTSQPGIHYVTWGWSYSEVNSILLCLQTEQSRRGWTPD